MTLFETSRLTVRMLSRDDIDAMVAVYGDPEGMRWVGDGTALSREQCERWVEVTERNYAARGYGMAAAVLRAAGDVIGFCGIVHSGQPPEPELKYAFRRDVWGQGYAGETAAGMVRYAFAELGLDEIHATVYPENKASARVLEKAGLRYLKTEPSHGIVMDWYIVERAGAAGDAAPEQR